MENSYRALSFDEHRRTCTELCCRPNRYGPQPGPLYAVGDATPYRTLYEREQKCSADLRRQLDEAHRRINAQGELLRRNGLDSGLDEWIDELEAIHIHARAEAEHLSSCRQAMAGYAIIAKDATEKRGQAAAEVLPVLIETLFKLNDRMKNTPTMRQCRDNTAKAREMTRTATQLELDA